MTKWSISELKVGQPIWVAGSVLVLLAAAIGIAFPATLSSAYYLQQLQAASFVGILASGAMGVLLLGEIDLSLPWTVTATGMLACGLYSSGLVWAGDTTAIPAAILLGALIGGFNGLGVAVCRAPSMVWTLGVNAILLGLTVLYAGGYSPQTNASPVMRYLAVGRLFGVVPVAVIIWAVIAIFLVGILKMTPLGTWIYAVGRSPRVAYLAGLPTRKVIILSFVWSGICSGIAGVLLAGYSGQAFQAMGDPMLLPCIAAVVVGGTKVTGGEGSYLGTVVGVLVLTLLSNVLSLLQTTEASRLVIYGSTIILMLLVGGSNARRIPKASLRLDERSGPNRPVAGVD